MPRTGTRTGGLSRVGDGSAGRSLEASLAASRREARRAPQQMAIAFGVSRPNVTQHPSDIFGDGEPGEAAACEDSRLTGRDGTRYVTRLHDRSGRSPRSIPHTNFLACSAQDPMPNVLDRMGRMAEDASR